MGKKSNTLLFVRLLCFFVVLVHIVVLVLLLSKLSLFDTFLQWCHPWCQRVLHTSLLQVSFTPPFHSGGTSDSFSFLIWAPSGGFSTKSTFPVFMGSSSQIFPLLFLYLLLLQMLFVPISLRSFSLSRFCILLFFFSFLHHLLFPNILFWFFLAPSVPPLYKNFSFQHLLFFSPLLTMN